MKIQRIQNKIIREATDADHRTLNIDIQTQTQMKDIYGWGTKFGMIKCRTIDIPEFQNYEY